MIEDVRKPKTNTVSRLGPSGSGSSNHCMVVILDAVIFSLTALGRRSSDQPKLVCQIRGGVRCGICRCGVSRRTGCNASHWFARHWIALSFGRIHNLPLCSPSQGRPRSWPCLSTRPKITYQCKIMQRQCSALANRVAGDAVGLAHQAVVLFALNVSKCGADHRRSQGSAFKFALHLVICIKERLVHSDKETGECM